MSVPTGASARAEQSPGMACASSIGVTSDVQAASLDRLTHRSHDRVRDADRWTGERRSVLGKSDSWRLVAVCSVEKRLNEVWGLQMHRY